MEQLLHGPPSRDWSGGEQIGVLQGLIAQFYVVHREQARRILKV